MSQAQSGLSELSRAVVLNDTQLVRELTRKGHTVTWEPFPFEDTALHTAAEQGNAEMIPILLDAGGEAFIDSLCGNGWTPLGMAARGGHLEAAQTLLSRGASVDARDEAGLVNPPLSDAVKRGYEPIVHILLAAGANPNISGWMNLTPLDYAERRYAKTPDDMSRRILDAVSKAASKS